MSGTDKNAASDKKSEDTAKPAKGAARKGRDDNLGRALKSVYDETLREDIPDDLRDLLGKLD
ncbi:NepR family anti-sigma factor [Sphingomicrobium arenosum]|uniref:NepR family anti-sigma factor n=1 Tax=Sphingomicrobium arenosum TaxID=2233861 RepID=UPI0022402DD6|nr:NepR family anti-sigma factor [Sphingomicrobium arenosum]